MTITTSRGKTFPAEWAWGPVGPQEQLMLQIRDERPLSEIAADFEGCDRIHRQSDLEGDLDFEGYTALRAIQRTPEGAVRLTIERS